MEQSNVLLKLFNIFFPFTDFLYILQQEEYDNGRLIKWLPRFFFRRNFQVRDRLVITKRIKLTLVFIIFIWFVSLVFVIWVTKNVLLLPIWLILVPLFVLLGNTLISPYFELIKSKIRSKAALKVSTIKNLKVINIAGSYGKTTTKNFIYQLIQSSFRTQMIPGNINTPNGIADWIIKNLNSNTEILIAELDTYQEGEIAKSSAIIPADIAVLTNVGDQHLERFGNQKRLGEALFEVFRIAKPEAVLITTDEIKNDFKQQNQTLIIDPNKPIKYQTKIIKATNLSLSNQLNLRFALKVAELLKIKARFVLKNTKNLEIPDRRQQLTKMYGYDALDDSYNISFTTAQAGLLEAKKQAEKQNKKLLVLAAGIPELSVANQDKNRELGKLLSKAADQVIVLDSIFAQEIISGSDPQKTRIVSNLKEFLLETKKDYPVDKWFLLHEPELGDLYY